MVGAVLVGGASRRMGRPKALVEVDGVAMGRRVARALEVGGAAPVVALGGGPVGESLDLRSVPDRWPGEGPLAAVAAAIDVLADAAGPGATVVVVAACDQPDLTADLVRSLVAALRSDSSVLGAVPRTPDGRRHPFPSAWSASAAGPLVAMVEAGERRVSAALAALDLVEVATSTLTVADVDTPEDLAKRDHRG